MLIILGNDNYTSFSNSTSFEVLKNGTNSSIDISGDFKVGETMIGVKVYDKNGDPLVNIPIAVTVDGNLYSDVTINSTGGWNLTYLTNRTGNITVTVNYSGNDNYTSFNNSTNFEVLKNSTNSIILVGNVQVGSDVSISGQLVGYVGDGSDLLNVTVDGNVYSDVIIDSNGGWNLIYLSNRTGNITVTVSFNGNGNYTAFSNSTVFEVFKNSTNSSIVIPSDVKLDETITIGGIVFDENGGVLGDIGLNVTVGGKLYYVTTDYSGKWILVYVAGRFGNVSVSVSWTGNENYTGFTNNTKFSVINVKKADIHLFKKGVVSQRVKTSKFYIKSLKYRNFGNAVGSKTFSFKFSKKYSLSYLRGSGPVKLKFDKKTNIVTVYITGLASNALVKVKYKLVRKMKKDIGSYGGLRLVKKAAVKALNSNLIVLRNGYVYENFGKFKASKSLGFKLGKTILNYVKKSARVSSFVKNNQVRFEIKKIPPTGKALLNFGVSRNV
ncbi:hypothetical protein [Methanobrevibacter arboriphilus]|jgi:hypothetical protein|uniref:hypothetical protein n=1 Tax=Methanobrevibacter arboriphilus TaxID=39441 RepID=UPI0006D1FF82|nr:hypothetical protein [Methanobrevibacter arboriphilus]